MNLTDATRAATAARVAQAARAAQLAATGKVAKAGGATFQAGTAGSATGAGRGGLQADQNRLSGQVQEAQQRRGNAVQRFFDGLMEGAGKWGGKLLDGAVDLTTLPLTAAAQATKGVPVLGAATRAMEWSAKQTLGLGSGVLKGAGTMLEGIGTMVVHPVETVKGLYAMAEHVPIPLNPVRMMTAAYDVVANGKPISHAISRSLNPLDGLKEDGEFWKAAGGALLKPYGDAIDQGRYGEVAGRAIFDVGSLFIGAGEVNAALKAVGAGGRAAEVAGQAGRVARVAEEAGQAAKVVRAAEEAGQAAKAVSALDQLGQVADEASRVGRAAEVAGSGGRFMGGRVAEGAEIVVRRSSGAVEGGWKLVAERPDGRLMAAKDGMLKPIPPEELVRLNPKLVELPEGLSVTVRRSSGALDEGWKISGRNAEGRVLVTKEVPGGLAEKWVHPSDLLEANPQLAAAKAAAQVAQAGLKASKGVDEVVDALLREGPLKELQGQHGLGDHIYSRHYNPSGAPKATRLTQEAYAEAVGGMRGVKELPGGGVAMNDGYWHRRMSATGDISQSQAINRFYFNVKPDSAVALADHLTGELNRLGIPHQFKMPLKLENFNRMDAGVLYVDKAHVAQVQGLIDDFIRKAPGALDEGAPAFTKPVRKGVAWAEEPTGHLPPGRHSFGSSRADIIAEGIRQAPPGASPAQVKELVRERFRHYGLDPDQPWSNAR